MVQDQSMKTCCSCKNDTKNIGVIALLFGWKLYYHGGHWYWYCPDCATPYDENKDIDRQQEETQ